MRVLESVILVQDVVKYIAAVCVTDDEPIMVNVTEAGQLKLRL